MKRFIWLRLVFIFKILLAYKNMKVPFLKGLYYNFFGGFTTDQVSLYDLNKDNRKEYLSEFDWYKSRKINGKYSELLNNKVKFSEFVSKYISVPEVYLIKENNKYYDCNYNESDIDSFVNVIKKKKSVFLKPISKGKGFGVCRIDFKNGAFYVNMAKVNKDSLMNILKNNNNYFISEMIRQAKYLDNIYDKTSNTIRLITVREDKDVKVLYAVQRFGDKNSIPVDNGSKGGLVSKIDLETGVLSEARCIKNKNVYEVHPDSNGKIKGVVVPRFSELKTRLLLVMKKLPNIKFVAWDILMTDDDMVVIEANSSSGVNIIQVFGGQRNDVLGEFYKKEKIIK